MPKPMGNMTQLDLFEETLSKKIQRVELWIKRLQKEVFFLKEVYNLTQRKEKPKAEEKKQIQEDLFAS